MKVRASWFEHLFGRRFPNSWVALLILEKAHFVVDHGAAQLNSKAVPGDHDMG